MGVEGDERSRSSLELREPGRSILRGNIHPGKNVDRPFAHRAPHGIENGVALGRRHGPLPGCTDGRQMSDEAPGKQNEPAEDPGDNDSFPHTLMLTASPWHPATQRRQYVA